MELLGDSAAEVLDVSNCCIYYIWFFGVLVKHNYIWSVISIIIISVGVVVVVVLVVVLVVVVVVVIVVVIVVVVKGGKGVP